MRKILAHGIGNHSDNGDDYGMYNVNSSGSTPAEYGDVKQKTGVGDIAVFQKEYKQRIG